MCATRKYTVRTRRQGVREARRGAPRVTRAGQAATLGQTGRGRRARAPPPHIDLLQLRVFRFRFVEEGNVGIGVLPCSQEILVGDTGFGGIALLLIDPAQFQLRG
jgi:hypothetical protein